MKFRTLSCAEAVATSVPVGSTWTRTTWNGVPDTVRVYADEGIYVRVTNRAGYARDILKNDLIQKFTQV